MPKIIHILLSVIDNLGDIGFACELVRSFHERYPGRYDFSIWTDSVENTDTFFAANRDLLGGYHIGRKTDFTMKKGEILFLLFHHPLPEKMPKKDICILRIDYLSFDREWIKNHGKEHIESTSVRKIIEIIPSPLPCSGGVISPPKKDIDRAILAEKYGLDPKKKWISIFAYRETITESLILDKVKDFEVLILGTDISMGYDKDIKGGTDTPVPRFLPFLSLSEFSSVVKESHWVIVRGEVSFISTLQVGTPFIWNMYQEIGGFHGKQAEQFLDWIEADESYRDIFDRLNGQKDGKVKLSEIDTYFTNNKWKVREMETNLVEEIQKYIDTFENSL